MFFQKNYFALVLVLFLLLTACKSKNNSSAAANGPSFTTDTAWQLTEAQWRQRLSPEAYHILREKGTERAFTGTLLKEQREGVYTCGACALPLFESKAKFNSGTGWPSFYQPLTKQAVRDLLDKSHGMERTEVVCGRCGGHLGHVFEDGPRPTGLRYCINSLALGFEPKAGD